MSSFVCIKCFLMLHAEHAKRSTGVFLSLTGGTLNIRFLFSLPGVIQTAELPLEIKWEFQKLFHFIINLSMSLIVHLCIVFKYFVYKQVLFFLFLNQKWKCSRYSKQLTRFIEMKKTCSSCILHKWRLFTDLFYERQAS